MFLRDLYELKTDYTKTGERSLYSNWEKQNEGREH
jgi:hypothetical protein